MLARRQGAAGTRRPRQAHPLYERRAVPSLHAHGAVAQRRDLRFRRLRQRKVHKYSPDGKLLMSWGGPGTNPGEFNIVQNICTDSDGWVYVAAPENHRVKVFDGNG